MKSSHEIIDEKGRLVRLTKNTDGEVVETYYIGRDGEGWIKYEGNEEYIEIDGQKRYWGGIIDPLPADSRIRSLNEFTVFIIKPDGIQLSLERAVKFLIGKAGATVVAERDFTYTEESIRKMYPHFFAKEWEQDLFTYLMSGQSRCLLVASKHVHRKMLSLRNSIRHLFGCNGGPKVKSLVHSAQRQSDALKQALLFFSLDEVVSSVGLKHK